MDRENGDSEAVGSSLVESSISPYLMLWHWLRRCVRRKGASLAFRNTEASRGNYRVPTTAATAGTRE